MQISVRPEGKVIISYRLSASTTSADEIKDMRCSPTIEISVATVGPGMNLDKVFSIL